MADTTLTADEQRFFETGELQASMQQQADPASDPVALAALQQQQAAQVAQTVVPPVVESPSIVPPVLDPSNDATEILRRSLAEAQQRVGLLESNIQQLVNQQTQQQTPVAPDPAVDPLGAMMHQLDGVHKTVERLQADLQAQQSQQASVQQLQDFQRQVHALKNEFVKTHADFDDAYQHLRNVRINDLRSFGFNELQIKQTLFQEEAVLSEQAIRNAKNPAEVVYDMAKRHGFAGKQAAAPAQTPDVKLTAIQQAQAASKNLPSSPGVEEVTLDGLKAASDADLNKLIMDDKTWSKIVGRDQYPL